MTHFDASYYRPHDTVYLRIRLSDSELRELYDFMGGVRSYTTLQELETLCRVSDFMWNQQICATFLELCDFMWGNAELSDSMWSWQLYAELADLCDLMQSYATLFRVSRVMRLYLEQCRVL